MGVVRLELDGALAHSHEGRTLANDLVPTLALQPLLLVGVLYCLEYLKETRIKQ